MPRGNIRFERGKLGKQMVDAFLKAVESCPEAVDFGLHLLGVREDVATWLRLPLSVPTGMALNVKAQRAR